MIAVSSHAAFGDNTRKAAAEAPDSHHDPGDQVVDRDELSV